MTPFRDDLNLIVHVLCVRSVVYNKVYMCCYVRIVVDNMLYMCCVFVLCSVVNKHIHILSETLIAILNKP